MSNEAEFNNPNSGEPNQHRAAPDAETWQIPTQHLGPEDFQLSELGVFNKPIPPHWPNHVHRSRLQLHMHFCELVESWRFDVRRDRNFGRFEIMKRGEEFGDTVIQANEYFDISQFIQIHSLEPFVSRRGMLSAEAIAMQGRDDEVVHYIVLRNSFDPNSIAKFLGVVRQATHSLAVINAERAQAITIDNGKVGLVTSIHFNHREQIELNRIRTHRHGLVH